MIHPGDNYNHNSKYLQYNMSVVIDLCNKHKKQLIKLMGEVGMAVQKGIQTRVVGIIRYMLHSYCFSNNGISVKSSRDVRCTLLSLLPLFVYFFVLPSLLHPSILSFVFYACFCSFFCYLLAYAVSLGHTYSGINPSMFTFHAAFFQQ